MPSEDLCQHICCQHCESMERPIVMVTPGKMESRRQTVCFCTSCWQFTNKHHGKDKVMDMAFFRNMNWAVLRAYNLPDVDLLEAIYSGITACMDPEDARCAIITFLTGVIQEGKANPKDKG